MLGPLPVPTRGSPSPRGPRPAPPPTATVLPPSRTSAICWPRSAPGRRLLMSPSLVPFGTFAGEQVGHRARVLFLLELRRRPSCRGRRRRRASSPASCRPASWPASSRRRGAAGACPARLDGLGLLELDLVLFLRERQVVRAVGDAVVRRRRPSSSAMITIAKCTMIDAPRITDEPRIEAIGERAAHRRGQHRLGLTRRLGDELEQDRQVAERQLAARVVAERHLPVVAVVRARRGP